jgi:hypothetical protein
MRETMQTWPRFRRWLAAWPLCTAALCAVAIAGCSSNAAPSRDWPDESVADEEETPAAMVVVRLPKNATALELTDTTRLVLSVPAGKADSAVTALRVQFIGEGWHELSVVRKELTGTISFVRGRQQLTLTYADTEVVPAEIVLQAAGVDLEVADEP